jgi:hypothetical protein
MKKKELRRELAESFKNRAILYYLIFDELRKEFGAEKAEEVMGRAIYRRGAERGRQKYAQFAPADLEGVKATFLAGSADGGRLFEPEVVHQDDASLEIKHRRCPLKEAWQEMGLPDDEVARLCRIAGRIDHGTFEAAGFGFSLDSWQPGGDDGCCCLHIRPGK